MRTAGKVTGILMLLLGAVWILQGMNMLPGSFMTGDLQWAVYGGLLCAAGAVILAASRGNSGTKPRA